MAGTAPYPHAPIIEAVLDIRTRLSSELSQESLTKIQANELESYPTVKHPFQIKFNIEKKDDGSEPSTDITSVANGLVFVSKDGLQLFQARPDGFSHNRLAPYIDWLAFQSEARRLWLIYREIAKPELIEMFGLTYVNKIGLPSGVEISDYLKTYVQVPKELPQLLETHNFQIQLSKPSEAERVAITASYLPAEPDKVSISLTIQSFVPVNKPMDDISDEQIWSSFDRLRALKNLAFESSITDRVRAGFR